MSEEALERLREICLSLPEAMEKETGRPVFQVRDKTFVMFMDDHHGDGRLAIWCKAPPGVQTALAGGDPERFYVPPYVGVKGWVGVCLNVRPDWDEVAELVEEGYRMTAPKRLIALLDGAVGS